MLRWAITFFILAIIAAVFGFSNVAAGASNIAYFLAVAFLVLFVISLVLGRGATPPA